MSVLDLSKVSLALNVARNITSFSSRPAASQPVKHLKPSLWICGYEGLHLVLFKFFFFCQGVMEQKESLSVNETLLVVHSPLSLCHCICVCVCGSPCVIQNRAAERKHSSHPHPLTFV